MKAHLLLLLTCVASFSFASTILFPESYYQRSDYIVYAVVKNEMAALTTTDNSEKKLYRTLSLQIKESMKMSSESKDIDSCIALFYAEFNYPISVGDTILVSLRKYKELPHFVGSLISEDYYHYEEMKERVFSSSYYLDHSKAIGTWKRVDGPVFLDLEAGGTGFWRAGDLEKKPITWFDRGKSVKWSFLIDGKSAYGGRLEFKDGEDRLYDEIHKIRWNKLEQSGGINSEAAPRSDTP